MSWRTIQLGTSLCDQDQLICKLFENSTVKYIGNDYNFAKNLLQSADSENLVLVINSPIWVSELIDLCKQHLTGSIETFYIGVNRYVIKGNDTDIEFKSTGQHGQDLVDFISQQLQEQDYTTTKSGHFDQDMGKYFNFVQPLTWLYGNKTAN